MKIETMFLVFIIGAILLIGCTQQQPPANQTPTTPGNQTQAPPTNQTPAPPENQTQTPPANNTPPQPASVDLSRIYQYGSVHSYEYMLTSTSGGQTSVMNFTTTVSSDTLNGTAAWLQQTDTTVQGTAVTSKTWLDKETYKCLKIMTVMNYGGQNIEQSTPCPTTGPNSASRTETTPPEMTYVGVESVTVPAGTYTCDKYSLENATYWVASNVPLPVKVAYVDGSVTMELVSYS